MVEELVEEEVHVEGVGPGNDVVGIVVTRTGDSVGSLAGSCRVVGAVVGMPYM